MSKDVKKSASIIGFREWVTLPELGLDAIKAKVDTGAKTSSLHAYDIALVKKRGKTYVNFKVHPIQKNFLEVISCSAELVDQRTVTDSGGHREERFVIQTAIPLGGIRKKIELTLTNRETMKYRMLIGREALKQFYIDPSQSYLMGKTLKQRRFLKGLKTKKEKAV